MDQKMLEVVFEKALRETMKYTVTQYAPDLQMFTDVVKKCVFIDHTTSQIIAAELAKYVDLEGIAKRIMTDYCAAQVKKYTLPKDAE